MRLAGADMRIWLATRTRNHNLLDFYTWPQTINGDYSGKNWQKCYHKPPMIRSPISTSFVFQFSLTLFVVSILFTKLQCYVSRYFHFVLYVYGFYQPDHLKFIIL